MPLQARDGSLRVTIVDGSEFVGSQAKDGSLNVSISDGVTVGLSAKDGSTRVTVVGGGAVVTDALALVVGASTYTFTVVAGVITDIVVS